MYRASGKTSPVPIAGSTGQTSFPPVRWRPFLPSRRLDFSDGLRQAFGRELDRRYLDTLNRTTALAVTAITEALRQAAIRPEDLRQKKVGIALGTTVGCSFLNEEYYRNWKEGRTQDDGPIFDYLSTNLAEQVQRILQVTGPRAVITNACASGTDAIGLALEWLRHGLCDIAIAGGADGLSRVACHGFSSLMLASKNPCRPFDADRDGLNLGEGAGVLIMEREASALARQAAISGWVRGYGSAGDAYHPTAPHPEGRGLQAAIHQAVHDAGITLADIGFINAHGTGTPANDRAELTALAHLGFADRPDCPVVSTKGATGHTLGAAGGIEAVLTLCTLNAGTTFGSTGCMNRDTTLPLVVPTAGEQCRAHRQDRDERIPGLRRRQLGHHPGRKRIMKVFIAETPAYSPAPIFPQHLHETCAGPMDSFPWPFRQALRYWAGNHRSSPRSGCHGLVLGTAFGPMQTNFDVLDQVVQQEQTSPTLFSHSVFNAAAGYLSRIFRLQGSAITVTDFAFPFFQALQQGSIAVASGRLDSCLILQVETYSDILADARTRIIGSDAAPWQAGAVAWLLTRENGKHEIAAIDVQLQPSDGINLYFDCGTADRRPPNASTSPIPWHPPWPSPGSLQSPTERSGAFSISAPYGHIELCCRTFHTRKRENMEPENNIVFISGASRGIGAAIARYLAAAGYDIWLNYRSSEDAALAVQKDIEDLGRRCLLLPFDVSDEAQTKAVLEPFLTRWYRSASSIMPVLPGTPSCR